MKDEPVLFMSDRSNCRVDVFNVGPSAGPCGTCKRLAQWKKDTGFDKT